MQSRSRNKWWQPASAYVANKSACLVQYKWLLWCFRICIATRHEHTCFISRAAPKVTSADLNGFISEKLQSNTYRNSKIFTIIHKNIIICKECHAAKIYVLICTVLQHLIWQTNVLFCCKLYFHLILNH